MELTNVSLMKCFTPEQQRLSGSSLEELLFKIFFPPICIFGVVGNLLNLMVFFSSAMKTRARSLLSCLAICDICFLLLMVPHSLANFHTFAYSYLFRWFYLKAKIHLITFANWNSAIAIWMMIAVCAERVMGVRDPLGHDRWSRSCITIYVLLVVILAGCLTFYNHFSYICFVKDYCHHTQVMAKCFDVTRHSRTRIHNTSKILIFHQSYVKWSVVVNALFVVFIPIVLLIALNIALIWYIKRRSFVFYQKLSTHSCCSNRIQNGNCSIRGFLSDPLVKARPEQVIVHKTEQRVAITVCAIVSSFTLTQGPSAIVSTISSFMSRRVPDARNEWDITWYHLHTLASFLVIIGKAITFVMFCLTSCSFRRHLIQMLHNQVHGRRSQKHSIHTYCNTSVLSNARKGLERARRKQTV